MINSTVLISRHIMRETRKYLMNVSGFWWSYAERGYSIWDINCQPLSFIEKDRTCRYYRGKMPTVAFDPNTASIIVESGNWEWFLKTKDFRITIPISNPQYVKLVANAIVEASISCIKNLQHDEAKKQKLILEELYAKLVKEIV